MRIDDGLEPTELYDVETDPHQQENLVDEAGPGLLGDLMSRLIEQAYRFGDDEVTGAGFRLGSPWGPELDDAPGTLVAPGCGHVRSVRFIGSVVTVYR